MSFRPILLWLALALGCAWSGVAAAQEEPAAVAPPASAPSLAPAPPPTVPAPLCPCAPAPVTPRPAAPAPTPAAAPFGVTSAGHWVFVREPAASATTPGGVRGPVYQHANTWDLNIDGAFGRFFGDDAKWTGFVRARAGLLFVREPLYEALGLTYEYSSLDKATFGVQAELLHLDSGLWGQVGGLLDVNGHPGFMAAAGFSVVGVEAQYRTYDGLGDGVALYVKLRLPIGVLRYVLGTRDAKPAPAPSSPPAPPKP